MSPSKLSKYPPKILSSIGPSEFFLGWKENRFFFFEGLSSFGSKESSEIETSLYMYTFFLDFHTQILEIN